MITVYVMGVSTTRYRPYIYIYILTRVGLETTTRSSQRKRTACCDWRQMGVNSSSHLVLVHLSCDTCTTNTFASHKSARIFDKRSQLFHFFSVVSVVWVDKCMCIIPKGVVCLEATEKKTSKAVNGAVTHTGF